MLTKNGSRSNRSSRSIAALRSKRIGDQKESLHFGKNERKECWEDTLPPIEADEHLHRCLVYIDLNMVRAGMASNPREWIHSGYRELQEPPKRYGIIDLRELSALCGFAGLAEFQHAHRQWVEEALTRKLLVREDRWSEAIAIGSLAFIETVKGELGSKALHRGVEHIDRAYALRERSEAYDGNLASKSEPLRLENTVFWNENPETTET
jgi:putative transposase